MCERASACARASASFEANDNNAGRVPISLLVVGTTINRRSVLYVCTYVRMYRRHYIYTYVRTHVHHSAFVFVTMARIGRPLIVIRLIIELISTIVRDRDQRSLLKNGD